MITDVFAADPDAIPAYRQAGFPDPQRYGFRTLRARGLDPVALAALDALLSETDLGEAIGHAAQTPDQEPDLYAAPVVTPVSSRIVTLLPAVGADQLTPLAQDWAGLPELAGASPESVRDWLAELQPLCREAVDNAELLFVWNCL
ncbi:hypothetical protein [Saccharopolyspora sp. SCSIO 74807]|uniref:hypothetical protein n=1 Tax=Saccharopolyspora sp. SCSIO 74807 TaxID=3118084 RepID=UPI0030D15899